MQSKTAAQDLSFIVGQGEMAQRIRGFDWKNHPLGPPQQWPQSLKIVIRIMLTSRYAMWLGWGEEFYFFCNDAYLPTVGLKRDWVLGSSARKVWAEIWPDIGPRAESVVQTGNATWDEALLLFLERSGYVEETYHTFSYSPVPNDENETGGMLCVVTEETERVIGERRLATLRDIAAELDMTRTEEELFAAVGRLLAKHPKDLPFGLMYLFDDSLTNAELVCAHPIEPGDKLAPTALSLQDDLAAWRARHVVGKTNSVVLQELPARFETRSSGGWDKPPTQAALVPLMQQGQDRPAGFFVAGLNPYRQFDAAYRGFVELLSGQIAAAWSNVRAYEAERTRAEALAELDRAKTAFFSNISHEFRTPLTLMLGPLEDELRHQERPNENLKLAYRSSLRLLKLVNSLLDFSRIEAGRMQASFEPVDLASYTSDLAGVFRSAVEKAGLRLIVDCPPLVEPVYVDKEMWEKVVSNLLSNAFKFTFEGEITVSLRDGEDRMKFSVSDTGVGIPEAELPRIFQRFHRVRGTRSRSFEGTGIGLALVQELVLLHGGEISVRSVENKGTTFIIALPKGKAHLPAERLSAKSHQLSTSVGPAVFLEEALHWLPPAKADEVAPSKSTLVPGSAGRPRIVLADDNADMRHYVHRLLAQNYEVEAVADGEAALNAIQASPPDLILTDVMMPKLDGFGLLERVRAQEETRPIPFILLSARAGEEARVEGLGAGADEYLIKPFSARELLARVRSQLEMAKLRREAFVREQGLREQIQMHANNLEKIVARRTAKLEETISELEHFSYAITHDMRAPLRAMQGFAGMIEEDCAGDRQPVNLEYVRRIKAAATRLDQLIADSLNYSKTVRQELPIEPIDLGELIPGLIETYPNLQPDKADIRIEGILPTVLGNQAALTQCFSNLLGNAVKFSKTGTRPHVVVWAESSAESADNPGASKFLRVWVEDDGIGIPKDALERVFGMFQRAAKGYEGTGIGLAIVRKVVEQMGGKVGVVSEQGQGSRFWVELRGAVAAVEG